MPATQIPHTATDLHIPLAGFGDLCFLDLKMLFIAKEPNYVVFFPIPWTDTVQAE